MSYFDDASLVMIPSGYKDQKVYSVKPLDGSGDLTFSRASSATRVASNGLIEKVRTNVVLRSQEQSDAQYGAIINQIASRVAVLNPLTGVNNAYKITSAGGSDPYIGQTVSGLSNGENTFSLWLWTDSGQNTSADLIFYNAAATEVYSTSLTITTTPTRYSFTVNFASIGASSVVRLDLCQSCGVTYLYTYGWQAESGVMTDYIPTVTSAVSVGPVSGLPRLDYLNSTCPRLLLEPQRTNTAYPSESFSGYTGSDATVVSNQATSPDGYVNADLLYPATAGNYAGKYLSLASSTTGVVSCFVKQAGKRYAIIGTDNTAPFTCIFDLQTATVVYEATNYTGKIESYGNGWYRISATYTSSAGNVYPFIGVADAANGSVTVDGTNGIYVWGFQYELNATYATSYIPTLGTSVTRVADAASKTGISSLIGQTEGTVFVEFKRVPKGVNYQAVVTLQGASSAYLIEMYFGASNTLLAAVYNSGAQFQSGTSALTEGTYKAALAYKENDFAFYVNGVQISTDNNGTVPALSTYNLGDFTYSAGFPQADGINQALLFKTRLTNAQLAELTTI